MGPGGVGVVPGPYSGTIGQRLGLLDGMPDLTTNSRARATVAIRRGPPRTSRIIDERRAHKESHARAVGVAPEFAAPLVHGPSTSSGGRHHRVAWVRHQHACPVGFTLWPTSALRSQTGDRPFLNS